MGDKERFQKMAQVAASQAVVHVTREDQEKINTFARKHQSNLEIKTEMKNIQAEIQRINDALEEIELHDEDEDGKIPYQMGDLYVFLGLEETEEYIKEEQRNAAKRMTVGISEKRKRQDSSTVEARF